MTERNITSDSVVISYTTINGCSDFSLDLQVQLSISECNETSTEMTYKNEYIANGDEETFILTSLMSNCYYSYTLQVVDGNNILEMSDSGVFMTNSEDTTIGKFGTFNIFCKLTTRMVTLYVSYHYYFHNNMYNYNNEKYLVFYSSNNYYYTNITNTSSVNYIW